MSLRMPGFVDLLSLGGALNFREKKPLTNKINNQVGFFSKWTTKLKQSNPEIAYLKAPLWQQKWTLWTSELHLEDLRYY